jgi:hypothetical protein
MAGKNRIIGESLSGIEWQKIRQDFPTVTLWRGRTFQIAGELTVLYSD